MIPKITLNELLMEADALFTRKYKDGGLTYNYMLGRFPEGWNFVVVNNWKAWREKDYPSEFGLFPLPQHAVSAFLWFVRENRVDVAALMHDE